MAMGVNHGGGRRADINVTPLVDVVLVLLIIFMVVSPNAISQVPNAVPQAAALDASAALTSEQIVLELRGDGSAWLNSNRVSLSDVASSIRKLVAGRAQRVVFVAADDIVPYGRVVAWMAIARREGASTVALRLTASPNRDSADP